MSLQVPVFDRVNFLPSKSMLINLQKKCLVTLHLFILTQQWPRNLHCDLICLLLSRNDKNTTHTARKRTHGGNVNAFPTYNYLYLYWILFLHNLWLILCLITIRAVLCNGKISPSWHNFRSMCSWSLRTPKRIFGNVLHSNDHLHILCLKINSSCNSEDLVLPLCLLWNSKGIRLYLCIVR